MLGSIGDRDTPNKIKSSWGCQIALNIKPELDVCFHNFLTLWGNKYFFTISCYCPSLSAKKVLGNPCSFPSLISPGFSNTGIFLSSFLPHFTLSPLLMSSPLSSPLHREVSLTVSYIHHLGCSQFVQASFLHRRVMFLRRKRKKMQALVNWRGDLSLLYPVILDTSECWDLEKFDLYAHQFSLLTAKSMYVICSFVLVCGPGWADGLNPWPHTNSILQAKRDSPIPLLYPCYNTPWPLFLGMVFFP